MENIIKRYVEKDQYKVMVAVKKPLIHLGIERLLNEDGKFMIVENKNIDDLLGEANDTIDMLFVDFASFSEHYSQIETLINQTNIKVVVLGDQHNRIHVKELIFLDVYGYLDIGMSKESFTSAINDIIEGKYYFHPSLTKDIIDGYLDLLDRIKYGRSRNDRGDKRNPMSPYNITKRELEVVHLIVNGMNNERMAETLQVSEKTIKNHLSSIFKKLNAESRTQVAIKAITEGWVSLQIDE